MSEVSDRETSNAECGPTAAARQTCGTRRDVHGRRNRTRNVAARFLQPFHKDLRLPAAPVVEVAPAGREVVWGAELKAALLHEEVDRLRGQAVDDLEPEPAGLVLGVLDQLGADPAVL